MKAQTKQLTWMEFDVIRWQNSPSVLKMSLEAKGAYFGLICSEWVRGPLPNDPEVLWQYAGAKSPADFDRVKDVVLAKFKVSQDGQFLSNDTVQEKREKALELIAHRSELRSKAGKKGAAAKWQNKQSDGKCHTEEVHQKDGKNGKTMAPGMANDGNQQDLHNQQDLKEQKKKFPAGADAPSGGVSPNGDKPTDPRRKDFLAAVDEHLKRTIPDEAARPQFHPEVTVTVDRFLKARPKASVACLKAWLYNRETSDKVNYAESPRKWIPRLNEYAQGPLDYRGKPKRETRIKVSEPNGGDFALEQRRKRELATAERAGGGSL